MSMIVSSALFSARIWRRNDVTICSTSPILWTVERSDIASSLRSMPQAYAPYERVQEGKGAFP